MTKLLIESLVVEFWNLNCRAQKYGGGDEPERWVGAGDLSLRFSLGQEESAELLQTIGFESLGDQGDSQLAVGFVMRRGVDFPIEGEAYHFADHTVTMTLMQQALDASDEGTKTLRPIDVNGFKMARSKDAKMVDWKMRVQGEIPPETVAWLYNNQRQFVDIAIEPPPVVEPGEVA